MGFTHLHLHSTYSLLDGAIRIEDLMNTVRSKGMNAVALTDHGNLFGVVDFYKKATKENVKPIIGMEAYVAGPRGRTDRTERVGHHLILLARNAEGYANLRALSSASFRDGFYYDPRIDKALLKEHSRGLIGLSACLGGEIGKAASAGNMDQARRIATEYRDIFEPGRYYLELQWNHLAPQLRANEHIKELAEELHLPLVATADAHYLRREDARAQDILMTIGMRTTLSDPKRIRHETDKFYVCSPEEMRDYFRDIPEAVDNTMVIAEAVEAYPILSKPMLPSFKVPSDHTPESYLEHLAVLGLERRFKEVHKPVDQDAYRARLAYELSIIKNMGFAGYFLIVQDFINWSKSNGIPVGPGRGSGAGSLVAWSLRITDIDPIPFQLLFERFMNPERVSLPDFDIDFCEARRGKVIEYVQQKYGRERVGQIITFGMLRAKSAIRDVCRVHGLPVAVGDRIAKLVPEVLNLPLKHAIYGDPENGIVGEPQLREMIDRPEQFGTLDGEPVTSRDVLQAALALEGLTRNPGVHAAGIVIAEHELEKYVPVYKTDEKTGCLVTQFSKDDVEAAGLVKFDFLGLKTLTVIDDALKRINRNRPEDDQLSPEKIPIDDPATFALLCAGNTAGVFQVESSGFTDMVMHMRPSRFEDIIAAGALFRPGPRNQKLDDGRTMVDLYIDRKLGRDPVQYPHPDLEPVLKDTYGVIVYQEQVMQIAQVLGGYSLGGADLLRRAMGKKKVAEMAAQRTLFVEGAKKRGVAPGLADEIFTMMEKFAEYGFNKSHSAAYGLLTIQTAYLKAHYPLDFTAALLTGEKDTTEKIVAYIADARMRGIKVLPPSVNESESAFTVVGEAIRFGLSAIKGVGEGAVEAIVAARAKRPFASLFDFCERVDSNKVNRKVVEALVLSGAFDFEERDRRQVFEAIERAMDRGAYRHRERESGQHNLFQSLEDTAPIQGEYPDVEPWTERERLEREKNSIGFFVSGHPLDQFERELRRQARPISSIAELPSDTTVKIAGVVSSVKEFNTKTGKRMARADLEDLTGSVKLICFPGRDGNGPPRPGPPRPTAGYETWAPLLHASEPILVTGVLQVTQRDENKPTIEVKVEEVTSLRALRERRLTRVALRLPAKDITKDKLDELCAIAKRAEGHLPVDVTVCLEDGVEIDISDTCITTKVSDYFVESANRLFGRSVVEL